MQARRQIESWWLWIAVDLVYVPLDVGKGLPLTGALYVLFLGLCLVGIRTWRREHVRQGPSHGHGVVAGKFLPYDRGHRLLISTALARCERVTVLVCEKRGQPIPGRLRAEWIRESLPKAEVVVVDQDAAGLDDDDSEAWAAAVIRVLGHAPDAAFTSEAYGEAWSATMGATHVLVDRERVPISATRIREAPLAHLGFLESHAARWFQPALVCIVGAESTGKTTLAGDLAGRLGCRWVPEYGRLFTEMLPEPSAHAWTESDFLAIAERQDALEDGALTAGEGDVVICDTSSFATSVFCREYTGRRSARVEALAAARTYDLFVIPDPATPFVQDATGLRVDGERRRRMHARSVAHAEEGGTPFVHVTGSREERVEQALAAIAKMLEGRPGRTWRSRNTPSGHADGKREGARHAMRRGRTALPTAGCRDVGGTGSKVVA